MKKGWIRIEDLTCPICNAPVDLVKEKDDGETLWCICENEKCYASTDDLYLTYYQGKGWEVQPEDLSKPRYMIPLSEIRKSYQKKGGRDNE